MTLHEAIQAEIKKARWIQRNGKTEAEYFESIGIIPPYLDSFICQYQLEKNGRTRMCEDCIMLNKMTDTLTGGKISGGCYRWEDGKRIENNTYRKMYRDCGTIANKKKYAGLWGDDVAGSG